MRLGGAEREYERIRPQVLFGEPVPARAEETGTSERTLCRRIAAFREEGMESLFGSPKAKRRVLPPAIRRKIVDLKAEHPPLNLEEIANVCGTLFGRRPDGHSVQAMLKESAIPRKLVRRFPPHHEIPGDEERREAVVTLREEGWSDTESWSELVAEHDLWLERHNTQRTQRHFAHENRDDGRRSPREVLGPVRVVRHHPGDLSHAFHSTMLVRKLDAAGYARVKHWRVYAEEGLASCEVAVWFGDRQMAVEYDGRTLSRYDVALSREARLERVTNPRLFATPYPTAQPKLFALDAVGEGG